MIRLFVGIDPPPAIKRQLLDLMGGLAGARWQREDQLHLTVRFIGEVDSHQARDIAARLAAVRHRPVDAYLDGVGSFASRGRPDSLWVGVAPEAGLRALHNKVDQALVTVGIAPELRSYKPHITLARLRGRIGGLEVFMAGAGGLRSPAFTLTELCLYRSTLTSEGSVYDIVQRSPLI
jgi:RNA 2',3'-cyclic 3'-phosphodiesterase